MKLLIILSTILIVEIINVQAQIMHDPDYCYTQDPIRPQNGMHASQSAYEAIRRPAIDPNISACTPAKFWYLGRHGGRLPDAINLNRIFELAEGSFDNQFVANHQSGRTSLCDGDFDIMRGWYPDVPRDSADELTAAGYENMISISRHYQSAFPTLLPPTYSNTSFVFRHTGIQRTERSAVGICEGLFGVNGHLNVQFEEIPANDTFLRPHAVCPTFTNLASIAEANAFQNGPEFRSVVSAVNEKLGFRSGSDQLSVQEVRTLWEICRFQKAMNLTRPSPMCGAFSVSNNEVLEFREDLESYYVFGYGVPNRRLVENLTCGIVQNLLRFIQSTDATEETARIYVTHSSALQTLMVSLRLFEDDLPLSRHSMTRERLWKASWISPKAANLVAVRFDCADGDHEVALFYNERPLVIPGCENGLCKVNHLIQRYSRFLNADCDTLYCTSN